MKGLPAAYQPGPRAALIPLWAQKPSSAKHLPHVSLGRRREKQSGKEISYFDLIFLLRASISENVDATFRGHTGVQYAESGK